MVKELKLIYARKKTWKNQDCILSNLNWKKEGKLNYRQNGLTLTKFSIIQVSEKVKTPRIGNFIIKEILDERIMLTKY